MAETNATEKKTEKKTEIMEEIELPLTYNKEEDAYPVFFSHNFKTYLIKRGEKVKVPKAIAERVRQIEKSKREAYEYSVKKSLDTAEAEFKQRYNLK